MLVQICDDMKAERKAVVAAFAQDSHMSEEHWRGLYTMAIMKCHIRQKEKMDNEWLRKALKTIDKGMNSKE